MAYIQHVCKNIRCERIFIDKEPRPGCMSVQTWKYCPECVKSGFINPATKPISEEKSERAKKMSQNRWSKI